MPDTHGTITWTELMTRDVDAAVRFYSEICGWEVDTMPMPDGGSYHVAKKGDDMVCGLFDMTGTAPPEAPPMWMTYLAVDDVDASVDQVRKAGGMVHKEPFDIVGVGRIAMIADPTGAMIGIMTPSD